MGASPVEGRQKFFTGEIAPLNELVNLALFGPPPLLQITNLWAVRGGWGKNAIWGKTSWASYPTSISVAKVGRLDARMGVQTSNFCHRNAGGVRRP